MFPYLLSILVIQVKIKAAGGIASFEDAEEFIKLGAEALRYQ